MAVAAVTVACTLVLLRQDMVLSILDRLRREDLIQLMSLRVLVRPHPHSLVHVSLNLDVLIPHSRVVECLQHIVGYFVHRNVRVVPREEHTPVHQSNCQQSPAA